MIDKETFHPMNYVKKEYIFRDLTKNDNFMNENIFGENIALLPAEAYFCSSSLKKSLG